MPQLTFFYCTRYVVHSRMCVCFVSMFSSSQVNNGFGNGKWTCCMCVCVFVLLLGHRILFFQLLCHSIRKMQKIYLIVQPRLKSTTRIRIYHHSIFFVKSKQNEKSFFFCNTYTRCKHTTTGVVFS